MVLGRHKVMRIDTMNMIDKDIDIKNSNKINEDGQDNIIDPSYLGIIYPQVIKLGDDFYACGSLDNIDSLYRQNGKFVCKLYRDGSKVFGYNDDISKISLFGIFNEEVWVVTNGLKSKEHGLYELGLWDYANGNPENIKSVVYHYDQLGRKIEWNKWNKDIIKPQHVAGTECIKTINNSGDYIGRMISFSNKPSGWSYIFVSIDNEINVICTSEAIRFNTLLNSVLKVDNEHGGVREVYQIIKKGRDAYRLIMDRNDNEIKIISVEKQDLGLLNGLVNTFDNDFRPLIV